jgi:hypothetical protein
MPCRSGTWGGCDERSGGDNDGRHRVSRKRWAADGGEYASVSLDCDAAGAALFAERADVFVAGDLLWYPVEGRPDIRRAPDVLVAIGRPKGDRGAYLQWEEGGQAPQVVFEVLSPGNTLSEMARKFEFYDQYGVEEYYLIDPERGDASGWVRRAGRLAVIADMNGWVSPVLGVRFTVEGGEVRLFYPDGRPFLTFEELARAKAEAEARAAEAEARAKAEAKARAEAEARAARLAERLRALGIDPNGMT